MTVDATDGSALGNPGPGGWAWVTEDGRESFAAAWQSTNNRMELRALRELLVSVPAHEPLLVQAHSEYVVNIFNKSSPRPRQNVVLEMGMLLGMLKRERVAMVYKDSEPAMEMPSDMQGYIYLPFKIKVDEVGRDLARESAAGFYEVPRRQDLSKSDVLEPAAHLLIRRW